MNIYIFVGAALAAKIAAKAAPAITPYFPSYLLAVPKARTARPTDAAIHSSALQTPQSAVSRPE